MKITFNSILSIGLILMLIYLDVTGQKGAVKELVTFGYFWSAYLLISFIYKALDWDKSVALFVYGKIHSMQMNRARKNALNHLKKQK